MINESVVDIVSTTRRDRILDFMLIIIVFARYGLQKPTFIV
jgi:hypothetical protein